ncbi:MAG: hypothetical protein R3F54_05070 [Alphaproteobacteria bacterium]
MRRGRKLTLASLLALLALASTSVVRAEVVDAKGGPVTVEPKPSAPVLQKDQASLECWQNGRRIIQQAGLRGVTVKALTSKGAVAFKQDDDQQPDLFLLPFDDSLCLISPAD